MDHPLDRPVWSALTSRQRALALGDDRALRFAPDYGPFGAAADGSAESLAALAALIPPGDGMAVVEAERTPLPPGATVAQEAELVQMTAAGLVAGEMLMGVEIVDLGEADAAEMRALAELTRPGPFSSLTHRLGDFVGIKEAGRLVAMAGERMKPAGFTEVSGVCTRPERRGRGYAAALIRVVAGRILARGETAFLHSYASNVGAIGLYESLGFAVRRPVLMRVVTA